MRMHFKGPAIVAGYSGGQMLAGILGACLVVLVGIALYGRATPTAPTIEAPEAGALLEGAVPTTTLDLQWRHGGQGTAQRGGVPPQNVSYFLICFYNPFTNQGCFWPGGLVPAGVNPPDHAQFAKHDQIPRTLIPGPLRTLGGDPAYTYNYDFNLPDTVLDQNLEWTVGACSGQRTATCSFAAPQRLVLSARNLTNLNISDGLLGRGNLDIRVEYTNDSPVPSPAFQHQTSMWEILIDSSNMPVTDVNGIRSGTVEPVNWKVADRKENCTELGLDRAVIFDDGTVSSILSLPILGEGQRDDSKVWAIPKPCGEMRWWWDNTDPSGMTPGEHAIVAPCNPNQRPFGSDRCIISIPLSSLPTGFAGLLLVDVHGAVTEYNEDDNRQPENNMKLL